MTKEVKMNAKRFGFALLLVAVVLSACGTAPTSVCNEAIANLQEAISLATELRDGSYREVKILAENSINTLSEKFHLDTTEMRNVVFTEDPEPIVPNGPGDSGCSDTAIQMYRDVKNSAHDAFERLGSRTQELIEATSRMLILEKQDSLTFEDFEWALVVLP